MFMTKRLLRVTFAMPYGPEVLTEGLSIRVRVSKAALKVQNKASIEVYGLTTQLRESLLSQFTAWKNRKRQIGLIDPNLIQVKVEAGYSVDGAEVLGQVFVGEVVTVELISSPPDIGIKVNCMTHQQDRSKLKSSQPPSKPTLEQFVKWAASEMGLNYILESRLASTQMLNPIRSSAVVAAIIPALQDMYAPDIAAYIDDDTLVVKDRDAMIRAEDIPYLDAFVGIPSWDEWGVYCTTLYNGDIRLGGGMTLESKMNPVVNGTYVITYLEYDLTSREAPFYVKSFGSPPA